MKTECIPIGIKHFCKNVDVMDPTLNEVTSLIAIPIKAGLYSCCVWRSKVERNGNLYTTLEKIGIYLNGNIPEANHTKKLGEITVNRLAGFFANKTNCNIDPLRNRDACTGKDGFYGVSGYGAGEYPVYCDFQDGEIVALEIQFKED